MASDQFHLLENLMRQKIKNPWLKKPGYNCIGCAPNNPIGLHLEFYVEDDAVVSVWHPSPNYQGWIDVLHGGVIATLLDETGAWWTSYFRQRAAVTARLNVTYLRPASTLSAIFEVKATLLNERRNYATVQMVLTDGDGQPCAKAEGVYYMYDKDQSAEQFLFTECVLEANESED